MKRSALIAILLAASVLLSCDEDEPRSVLSISTDPSANMDVEARWVFVTNEKNELLDVFEVTPGIRDVVTDKSAGRIDVTYLDVFSTIPEYRNFQFRTYKNVPTGSVLRNLDVPSSFSPTNDRMANVSIKNYPGVHPQSELKVHARNGYPTAFSAVNSSYSFVVWFSGQSSEILILGTRNSIPVYYRTTVVNDAQLEIDFNEFLNYENLIEHNFKGYAFVYASDDYYKNLEIRYVSIPDSQPSFFIGTIPGFDQYDSKVASYSFGRLASYQKFGRPITSSIEDKFIDFVPTNVASDKIDKTDPKLSVPYEYVKSHWFATDEANGYSTWTVYAKSGTQPNAPFTIPAQILTRYPFISKERYRAGGVEFFKTLNAYDYSTFLDETIFGEPKAEREQLVLSGY